MDFWRERPVFVTGGTGFVGSWLVRELVDRGAEVVCLVRDEVPAAHLNACGYRARVATVTGSLEDHRRLERVVNEYEIDTVFHLGAQTIVGTAHRSPLSTFEANVRGTYNLLEAVRAHRRTVTRVVVASTDKAYGQHEVLPYTEEAPLQGRHPYDVSKSWADLLAQGYAHTYDLPVVILRCGNVYGGGDLNFNRLVPGTIRTVLRGERPVLRSDGLATRDYLYVRDAVAAYLLAAERLQTLPRPGEAFNAGCEVPVTVLEVVRLILSLLDRPDLEPVILDSAAAEIPRQYLSAEKARRVLGWRPTYSLERGLRETTAWYREFLAER